MLRKCMLVVLIVCMAIFLGEIGFAQAQPITLKLAVSLNPDNPVTKGDFKFAELVSKYTEGEVKVKVYHSGVLGADRAAIEGLKLGTIDMVSCAAGIVSTMIPKLQILDMPFLFRDKEHNAKVLDGPIGQELLDEFAAVGFKGLRWTTAGYRSVSNSKRPINLVDDMKGLKFRLPEIPPYVEFFKACGATAVPMAASELYLALKTGAVDGQDNGPAWTYTQNMYEALKYYSVLDYANCACLLTTRTELWEKLSANHQAAILRAAKESAIYEREVQYSENELYLQLLEDKGMEVNRNPDMTGFLKAAEEVYKIMSTREWYDQNLIDRIKAVK